MIRTLTILCTALALVLFVGCKPGGGNQNPSNGHTEGDGHDHAHGDDDHDHDHAGDAHDNHGHGESKELGTSQIGGFQVQATQFGSVAAGQEASLELALASLPPDIQAASVAVRVWIGTETGTESVKVKADHEAGNQFHAHVEAPSPLPSGSKWWVEIEASGQSSRGSFDLDG